MGIVGMTDGTPRFTEIARIRKGAPKPETGYGIGQDLKEFFRVEFNDDERDAEALFVKAYSDKPKRIRFYLAFPEMERNWDAWLEAYVQGGLLGRSDGERWLYLRDSKTNTVLVKDGVVTDEGMTRKGIRHDPSGVSWLPYDPRVPVYSYKNKRGEDVPVFAKPSGRLRLVVPECRRLAYMSLITSSTYDIIRVSGMLKAISDLCVNSGKSIVGVPLILNRKAEMISKKNADGGRIKSESWLLNIEPDQAWVEPQLKWIESHSYPSLPDELDENVIEENEQFSNTPSLPPPPKSQKTPASPDTTPQPNNNTVGESEPHFHTKAVETQKLL